MKTKLIHISLLLLIITGGFKVSRAEFGQIWHCAGSDTMEKFGATFTSIGDQNQDGFDDILVGNKLDGVRLYFGGNPMDTVPDLLFIDSTTGFGEGHPFSLLGQIDDNNELTFGIKRKIQTDLCSVNLYYGGNELDTVPEYTLYGEINQMTGYGSYMFSSDINNDGYNDIVISDPGFSQGGLTGKNYIYFGGAQFDTIPDVSWRGCTAKSVGDANGDGYDDVLCAGSQERAILYLGGDTMNIQLDWSYREPLGYTLSNAIIAPDVNGDQVDDIVLLYTYYYDAVVLIFYGGPQINFQQDAQINNAPSSFCMNYAGDVNNDGLGDIIIGNANVQRVYVYFGCPQFNWLDRIVLFYNSRRVGYAGDVNGDGVDDFFFNSGFEAMPLIGEVYIYSDTALSPVKDKKTQNSPDGFKLQQNYPNPFNQKTDIRYQLQAASQIKLAVFDIAGREAAVLAEGLYPAGTHQIVWDASEMSNGVYFARLKAGSVTETRKMLLVK